MRPFHSRLQKVWCKLLQAVLLGFLICFHLTAHAGTDTGLVGDDVVKGPFPIGFSFKYYGKEVTSFYASTNGLLQFSGPTNDYRNACLPALSSAETIYVFWDDLRTNVSEQPNGKIQYTTIGEAPHRKLVVQWTNQYFYGSNLPMGTFQAVLAEDTGEIKLQYRYLSGGNSFGNSATIGIQGPKSKFVQHSCNQQSLQSEQALSFIPDTAGENYTLNPAAEYNFIDIADLTPAPPVALQYVKSAPTWTWNTIPELTTYQIQIQQEDGSIIKDQTLGITDRYTWNTGFVHAQKYRARVRGSINEGGTWEVWSGLSEFTTIDLYPPNVSITSLQQINKESVEIAYRVVDDVSGVRQTHLQIASDPEFQNLLFDADGSLIQYFISPLVDRMTFNGGIAGQRLYTRIKATNGAGGESPYSAVADILMVPPPVAAFTATPASGEAPLEISLQNKTTGTVSTYLWNFGDSRTSTETHPAIRYTQPGSFPVKLRATGPGGDHESTQEIIVTPDITPPEISPVLANGIPVANPVTIGQTVPFTFTVKDRNGIQQVEVRLSGQLIPTTPAGQDRYQIVINPQDYPNGDYILKISAQDSVGNTAGQELGIQIKLLPPPPVLTAPTHNLTVYTKEITVTGTGVDGSEAQILLNGTPQAYWLPVIQGHFQGAVTLNPGQNTLAATVKNQRGTSEASAELSITYENNPLQGPGPLSAVALEGGKVRLTWSRSTDPKAVSYDIYRAKQPFDLTSQAQKINTASLTVVTLDDLPPSDGPWHYRVVALNNTGHPSAPGNLAQATADGTPPKAVSIQYQTQGKTDPATGRLGQGLVRLTLTVSEPLQSLPYLAIVPEGGVPIPVDLNKTSDTTYSGQFQISAATPGGLANALFSARDLIGNRGTEIEQGATLGIDTQGPILTGITLDPASPIHNTPPQTVDLTLVYHKAPAQTPQVSYRLSGPGRTATPLTLTPISPDTYRTSLTLPADAGLATPETLSLSHQAQDTLDNHSDKITAPNRHQIYQGPLPPLEIPYGLTAEAQPGGKVKLTWQPVAEAHSYQLSRQDPGQDKAQPLERLSGTDYTDSTPADGLYHYTIATVRRLQDQESQSEPSTPVPVQTRHQAPGAPQSLTLQLTGQGILANWAAPAASTVDHYNLYRGPGSSLTDITGLTPYKTGLKTLSTYDTRPEPGQSAYVITAVDPAGNESVPSHSAYLNPELLPVRNLHLDHLGNSHPELTWEAPGGNLLGYRIYIGQGPQKTLLTPEPIQSTRYTDTGYTQGERHYTIASVDHNSIEMPREIHLPDTHIQIISGLPLKRGIMNRLQLQITNTSGQTLDNLKGLIRLPVTQGNPPGTPTYRDHTTEPISLGPNQTRLTPIIVGGYPDLPSQIEALVGLEISPNEGERTRITQSQSLPTEDSGLNIGIAPQQFTRGGSGQLKLTVENNSEVDIELLTATQNGHQASSELRFKLLDLDGNLLGTQAYKQLYGPEVITLTNGETVARIPAGSQYTSQNFDLDIPAASPDKIRVRLEVDQLRYHSGQPDQIKIPGQGSERTLTLQDTPYTGDITAITPQNSYGEQPIQISGKAIDRATQALLPNTPLKLILNQQGYERAFALITDGSGHFTYTFTPTVTDSGEYQVSAVHPEMSDRPDQNRFTLNRVTVTPSPYRLDIPKNYPVTLPLQAKTGAGVNITPLQLALRAESQPTGQIPAGIDLQLPAALHLGEKQTQKLPVTLTGNNTAPSSGNLILDVLGGTPPTLINQVKIEYRLSEAKPYLVSTPAYLETGLARGEVQTESLNLKNQGQQDIQNLKISLGKPGGGLVPGWIALANHIDGNLVIGESKTINLSLTPPNTVAEGTYELQLQAEGDNLPPQLIPLYIHLTQSGQGHVLFKVSDIYTATTGKDGKRIEGLGGARITLENEAVSNIRHEITTDALGEALLQDLPAGWYKYKGQAENHQDKGGRVQIKPGVTVNQPLFLDYSLINVEWNVREIALEDRYEITVDATYETDVPAAVIILEPQIVNLPKMKPGEVFHGEFTLINYGLIRAHSLIQSLPANDAYFRYEFLAEVPESLEPKQRVTLPYRVTAIKSLEDEASDGEASGGGCYLYSTWLRITYCYECAQGTTITTSTSTGYGSASNSTCPVNSGPPIEWGGPGGKGEIGGWGGLSSPGRKCTYAANKPGMCQ